MSDKEKTTLSVVKKEENPLTMEKKDVIQQSVLPVLSEMYKMEDGTPETLLIDHSKRLTNVAHSYIEERENSYLNSTISEDVRKPSFEDIETVCKLGNEVRENIKLALMIKKEKSKTLIELVKAVRA